MLGVYSSFRSYAAVRRETLSSIYFCWASFVHCCALRIRNLRSPSSLARAACHSGANSHGGGAFSNLATFLVGQRDDNAITGATNELKRVLIFAGDFVHVRAIT
jgi:hypothetical protein